MMKYSETQVRLREMGAWATLILLAIAVVLVIAEFIFHRHGETPMEDWPLFPGVFGFMAFLLVVLGGVILRKLIMRGEDYYGDR